MPKRYWNLFATDPYINQVRELTIEEQEKILNQWMEVCERENPLEVGSTDSCGTHNPIFVVIFPGIAYEFMYEKRAQDKQIRLINCERLDILDYGQTE